ncbi:MAG: hypothetical protein WD035_10935 [Balneolaceae bacterium]
MRQLNRQKALDLLPLVVDDEAHEDDKRAFFKYLELDDELRRKYRSMKRVKEFIRDRTPRVKSPDGLKARIATLIEKEQEKSSYRRSAEEEKPKISGFLHGKIPPAKNDTSGKALDPYTYPRIAISAVAVLLLTLSVILALNEISPVFKTEFSLEEYVFSHFTQYNNPSIASLQPASLVEARDYMISHFNQSPRMPQIKGAQISGVFNIDFVPDFKTPMLEYAHEASNQPIYIFAFHLDSLEVFNRIVRNPEAVNICKSNNDFHVREIHGKHVVSWKWGDYWYTAISNQNGHDLAKLVKPLAKNESSRESFGLR